MQRSLPSSYHAPDAGLVTSAGLLLLLGVILVYDATVVYSFTVFGGKYHFLLLQSMWVLLGLLGTFFLSLFDYHRLARLSLPVLGLSLVLLLLVFVPGIGVEIYGARRWISLGAFTFQPSEFAKFALILYLSSWFSADRRARGSLTIAPHHQLINFSLLLLLMIGLVLLQPNLSIAMILSGIALALYFVSGAPLKHFLFLSGCACIAGVLLMVSSPYRLQRLTTYLNPSSADVLKEGYHLNQIRIALGSGGLWGRGLGQSRQKYDFLPEVCSDSIFAIVGEELGFVGGVLLILTLVYFLFRTFCVAGRAPDTLGQLLAVGFGSWFALQIFVNLSAMVGLIPLTGVTLPFISCGGSAALVSLAGLGVLINISRQTTRESTRY